MQHGFLFHIDQCIGCKACAIACARYKNRPLVRSYRKTMDFELGESKQVSAGGQKDIVESTSCFYTLSIACNHCDHPICVQACPTRALEFVDVRIGKELYPRISIAPLPPSSQTLPNMFFDIGDHASRDDLNEIIARKR